MTEQHCAHLKVVWTTEDQIDGSLCGWWECESCNLHFRPQSVVSELEARNAELEGKLAEVEAKNAELLLSKARITASKAVLMQGMAAFARAGHHDESDRWVLRADEAALAVRQEDLVIIHLNDAARSAEQED